MTQTFGYTPLPTSSDLTFCSFLHAWALAVERLAGQRPDGLVYSPVDHQYWPTLRDVLSREGFVVEGRCDSDLAEDEWFLTFRGEPMVGSDGA